MCLPASCNILSAIATTHPPLQPPIHHCSSPPLQHPVCHCNHPSAIATTHLPLQPPIHHCSSPPLQHNPPCNISCPPAPGSFIAMRHVHPLCAFHCNTSHPPASCNIPSAIATQPTLQHFSCPSAPGSFIATLFSCQICLLLQCNIMCTRSLRFVATPHTHLHPPCNTFGHNTSHAY